MPNWNSSRTTITGPSEDLREIIDRAANGDRIFSFEKFIPLPEYLQNGDLPRNADDLVNSLQGNRDHRYSSEYNWRIAFWGTKWDLGEDTNLDDSQISKGKIVLEYETAWSPAVNFWVGLSELYPKITILDQYFEEGNSFIGEAVIHNGQLNDYSTDITSNMYLKAGAVLDEDDQIDWDETDEYDLFRVFPLR